MEVVVVPVETPMFHHPLVITYAKVETLFAGEMKRIQLTMAMAMMRTRTLQRQPTMTMTRTKTRTQLTRTQLTMTTMRTRTPHQLISIMPKSRVCVV